MVGSREATAVTSHDNSIGDEIKSFVVYTVSVTKKPHPPMNKFTYKVGNFVVGKVDRANLGRFWMDKICEVVTQTGDR